MALSALEIENRQTLSRRDAPRGRVPVAALGMFLITLILALPVLVVFGYMFVPSGESWDHLASTVLPLYLVNTLLPAPGVRVVRLLIGVGTAWLVTMCDFPGRRIFSWALFLPLAMPAYIIAYTYTGMFDYAGPVQTALREAFGWGRMDYWFP